MKTPKKGSYCEIKHRRENRSSKAATIVDRNQERGGFNISDRMPENVKKATTKPLEEGHTVT